MNEKTYGIMPDGRLSIWDGETLIGVGDFRFVVGGMSPERRRLLAFWRWLAS